MASSKSIGRRRWKRFNLLLRRRSGLGRRPGTRFVGRIRRIGKLALIPRRSWGRRDGIITAARRDIPLQLKRVVENVAGLASHRVVNGEKPWAARNGLNNGLQTLLELLIVQAHWRADGGMELLTSTVSEAGIQIKARKLMGCSGNIQQLLL